MKKGYNDVLFLNEKGFICETSCANIFFIKNDKIFTPFSQNGLLNGIIRKWIIENYNVLEKNIKLSEINDFDEVFVSNSLVGIMPVNSINNIKAPHLIDCSNIKLIILNLIREISLILLEKNMKL